MKYTVITAKLTARTAIHIGSGQESKTTDALIRRDVNGLPIIPGTAIAGALRALLTRLGPRLGAGECEALLKEKKKKNEPCGCGVCRLFGDVNPVDKANASRLFVFNAALDKENPTPGSLIRDGVGINRVTGTSARSGSVKFDLEVLPANIDFVLRLELREQTNEDEKLLAAALSEWQAGRAWLGGRTARGLGAFDLKGLTFGTLDLNNQDNLLAFLKSDEPHNKTGQDKDWLPTQVAGISITKSDSNYASSCWFSIEGTLEATGPLLTNDTMTSGLSGFDHAPLMSQWGDWGQPVLAGSGLRGVIRSHAERLARTLATLNVNDKDKFLTVCCSPVESSKEKPLASCDSLLKAMLKTKNEQGEFRKIDEVEDNQLCLACYLFGNSWRGSRLMVEDAAYNNGQPPKLKMLDFLAVDRFTGGGKDGAKFDALALWKPSFRLRLHLDNPKGWELGWLALVLRDMQTEWLTVGMGAAKGFGRVRLDDLKLRLGYLSEQDRDSLLDGLNDNKLKTSTRNDTVYSELSLNLADMEHWVTLFNKKVVKEFSRPDELKLKQDSYFGVVDKLYPVGVNL